MPTHPEELALVKQIIDDDEEAAQEFARKYLPRFEFLARQAGVPYQDCSDVAQEAFLTIISQMKRGNFRGDSLLSTWMKPIIKGKIAEYWRDPKSARKNVSLELDSSDSHPSIVETLAIPSPNEDDVLAVGEALDRMPPDLRTILISIKVERVTIKEFSKITEMTMNQVSKRLYKAIDIFCELIQTGSRKRRKMIAEPDSPAEGDRDD